jgi:hypothetical protein
MRSPQISPRAPKTLSPCSWHDKLGQQFDANCYIVVTTLTQALLLSSVSLPSINAA